MIMKTINVRLTVRALDEGERIKVGDFFIDKFGDLEFRNEVPWRQKNCKNNVMSHYRIIYATEVKDE